MQQIRFNSAKQNEFIKELRLHVKDYFQSNNISKTGNYKLVIKTIFMFALYLVPYILMISGIVSGLLGLTICWVLMGFGMAGIGMGVMHDANHHSYSSNTKVNKWMSKTLYFIGGFPLNWQYQHNTLHHGFTNIEGHDEDISPVGIIRISPHKPLKRIHRFQHIYAWFFYGLMTILWATSKDFKQLRRYSKEGNVLSNKLTYRQMLWTIIISKTIYYSAFLLVPFFVLNIPWYVLASLFFLMHFTAGFTLTLIFQTAHVVPSSSFPLPDAEGSIENNWAVHQLLTTSDFSPNSRIFSWFLGGLNYQVEHHLFPNISHVHYRKLSELVQNMAKKYDLPYYVQSNFIKALWQHAIMLKKLGRA